MSPRHHGDPGMHAAPTLGALEWIEVASVAALAGAAGAALVLMLARARPAGAARPRAIRRERGAARVPELVLLTLGLPLELLWEIAQFPLYTVWHQNDWGYVLYGLAHCTLGDLLILLVCFEIVAAIRGSRRWIHARGIFPSGLLLTALGLGYTIYSEITHVWIEATWGYTEHMPIVPVLGIGGTPFLQWVLIPPVLLWLMRRTPA